DEIPDIPIRLQEVLLQRRGPGDGGALHQPHALHAGLGHEAHDGTDEVGIRPMRVAQRMVPEPHRGAAIEVELDGDRLPLDQLAQPAQFVEHVFQYRKQFRRLVAGAFSDGHRRRRGRYAAARRTAQDHSCRCGAEAAHSFPSSNAAMHELLPLPTSPEPWQNSYYQDFHTKELYWLTTGIRGFSKPVSRRRLMRQF